MVHRSPDRIDPAYEQEPARDYAYRRDEGVVRTRITKYGGWSWAGALFLALVLIAVLVAVWIML
jgi:hypothetical protein